MASTILTLKMPVSLMPVAAAEKKFHDDVSAAKCALASASKSRAARGRAVSGSVPAAADDVATDRVS